jgi:hypothetical protein
MLLPSIGVSVRERATTEGKTERRINMPTTISTTTELLVIQCNGNGKSCGGYFAVNKEWYENRRKYGGGWYYPYCGSSWIAAEDEITRLKQELNEAKRKETAALEEAKHFRFSRDRLLSRTNKGVCPHCNRYFKNLHRHVEHQHKESEKCTK